MWIGNDVTGSFQDQFDVLYGFNQMLEDADTTELNVLCGLERM
jgi:hypothetical protein